MSDDQKLPPCDEGLEKKLYEGQCDDCNKNGMYTHQGKIQGHICDYYLDTFLPKFRKTKTQEVEKPQNLEETPSKPRNTDTTKTRRMMPFEDKIPPPKSN